eukprot:CAMPEP_0183598244 /NCGR_PEP_ID=MMETSP0371-20130417/178342_1 /TAXON_ID=268820 /ORGANISM="Peridinium aciculiferum, Strain PAER-2" /LENGTH=171 /DNA_ID=CAMNT_0025810275 /DNA_START=105 /DNA_END=621 /DNA_ORIENTATION=+
MPAMEVDDVLWAINDDFAFSLQVYDFGRPLDHDVRSDTVLVLGIMLPMRHLLEGLARAHAAPQRLLFCQSPPAVRTQVQVLQASVAKLILYGFELQLEGLFEALRRERAAPDLRQTPVQQKLARRLLPLKLLARHGRQQGNDLSEGPPRRELDLTGRSSATAHRNPLHDAV